MTREMRTLLGDSWGKGDPAPDKKNIPTIKLRKHGKKQSTSNILKKNRVDNFGMRYFWVRGVVRGGTPKLCAGLRAWGDLGGHIPVHRLHRHLSPATPVSMPDK